MAIGIGFDRDEHSFREEFFSVSSTLRVTNKKFEVILDSMPDSETKDQLQKLHREYVNALY